MERGRRTLLIRPSMAGTALSTSSLISANASTHGHGASRLAGQPFHVCVSWSSQWEQKRNSLVRAAVSPAPTSRTKPFSAPSSTRSSKGSFL